MLELTKKHKGKRAFVTGAAMGLGRSFCTHLAKDGWTVGMSDVAMDKLEETAEEVKALGGTPIVFRLDVSDRNQYADVAKRFLMETGGIDLLVNNAGVGDGAAFHEYTLENWDWMIGINQMGVLYGCHYFVPRFREQGSGHIINIASAAGYANAPSMSPYNMTKAAVISLSETLYYELAPVGVNVSVVMPTFIKTQIMQHARGPAHALKAGQKFIERTKFMPDDAVMEMLVKAGRGKFEIVLPREARTGYWFKRYLPSIFRKQLMKIAQKQFERSKQ